MQPRRTLHSVSPIETIYSRSNYWPAGVICGISIGLLLWVFSVWSPTSVQNVVIANFFLPVVIILLGIFISGLLVVTMNIRRAVMWGVCLTTLVWLQLQHVLDILVFFYIVSPFIVSELILTVGKKK